MRADASAELDFHGPYDVRATFLLRGLGRLDPTQSVSSEGVLVASDSPEGPVTLEVQIVERAPEGGRMVARAWGPGATWAVERAASFMGIDRPAPEVSFDGLEGHFDEATLRRLRADAVRVRGARQGLALSPFHALTGIVLQQKVTFVDAAAAQRDLVRRFGAPAPGPHGRSDLGLRLPVSGRTLARLPYFEFHPAGVERKRAEILRAIARRRQVIDSLRDESHERAREVCDALSGIGPWSRESLLMSALGDTDAVSPGDYHLPNTIAWYLAREERADDARMFALLAPFRPYRARVILTVAALGVHAPRRGAKSARGWLRRGHAPARTLPRRRG